MTDFDHFRSSNDVQRLYAKNELAAENANNGDTSINVPALPNVPAMLKGGPYCPIAGN
jgi:hypothetical protein